MSDEKKVVLTTIEFPIEVWVGNNSRPKAGIYVNHDGRYVWYYEELAGDQGLPRTNAGSYWGGANTVQECLVDLYQRLYEESTNMRRELAEYRELKRALLGAIKGNIAT